MSERCEALFERLPVPVKLPLALLAVFLLGENPGGTPPGTTPDTRDHRLAA